MASPAFAAFLLVTLLSSSLAVHARQSHFFSKVSADTANPTNDFQQQQQPSFVQETDNNGYGLQGHQTPETTAYEQAAASTAGANLPAGESAVPVANGGSNNNGNGYFSESYFNNDKYYGAESEDLAATTAGSKLAAGESAVPVANGESNNNGNGYFSKSYFNNDKYYGAESKNDSPAGAEFLNSDDKFATSDESSNGVVEKQEYSSKLYNNDAENEAYRGNSFTTEEPQNGVVSSLYANNLKEEKQGTEQQQFGNSFSDEAQNGVVSNYNDLYGNSDEQKYRNSFSDESSNGVAKNIYGSSFSDNSANGVANVERQGMSDTRFMAGGKYYTEVNNPSQYQVNGMNDQYYGNSMNKNNNQQEEQWNSFQNVDSMNKNNNQQEAQWNSFQNQHYDP